MPTNRKREFEIDTVSFGIALKDHPVNFLCLPINDAGQDQRQTTARVPLFLNISVADSSAFSVISGSLQRHDAPVKIRFWIFERSNHVIWTANFYHLSWRRLTRRCLSPRVYSMIIFYPLHPRRSFYRPLGVWIISEWGKNRWQIIF